MNGDKIRICKDKNPLFTISAAPYQDRRLSWEARGLLTYLMNSDDCDMQSMLDSSNGANEHKLKRILGELKRCGYYQQTRQKDGRGRIVWQKTVTDDPAADLNRIHTPLNKGDGFSPAASFIDDTFPLGEIHNKAPYTPGIYIIWSDQHVLYIGESGNIRKRFDNHQKIQAIYRFPEIAKRAYISYQTMGGQDDRETLEQQYIEKYRPILNGLSANEAHNAIQDLTDAEGQYDDNG